MPTNPPPVWSILPPLSDDSGVRIVEGDWLIAMVYGGIAQERARLLAASPAMRHALRDALTLLTDPDADSFDAARVEIQIRAALRAAGDIL